MWLIDKKIVSLFLIVIFSVMVFIPGAQASNSIQVFINGQEKHFTPAPIIKNGSTLVPMRAFFEALGCEVKWDSKTRTAIGIRDGKEVKLPIGSKTAFVNGEKKRLTVEAQLINGSTFIPLRFVGESLGDEVTWNNGVIKIQTRYRERKRAGSQIVKVHFLDVGQADSIYIQAPDNYDILIDGGNNADGSWVVNYLKSQNVDDIEILIATHPHEDHIGGLDDVLKVFRVERIIDSGETADTKTYRDYWAAVSYEVAYEGAVYQEDEDMRFDIGEDMVFEIIELGDGYDNTNNNSVVALLDYKDREFLFVGDLESDVETKLIGRVPEVDVLKVGHHGSSTSTSEALLQAIKPSIAVISVGWGNKYGHPHQELLNRLSRNGIEDLRTDLEGVIVIATDGTSLKVLEEVENKLNNKDKVIETLVKEGCYKEGIYYFGTTKDGDFKVRYEPKDSTFEELSKIYLPSKEVGIKPVNDNREEVLKVLTMMYNNLSSAYRINFDGKSYQFFVTSPINIRTDNDSADGLFYFSVEGVLFDEDGNVLVYDNNEPIKVGTSVILLKNRNVLRIKSDRTFISGLSSAFAEMRLKKKYYEKYSTPVTGCISSESCSVGKTVKISTSGCKELSFKYKSDGHGNIFIEQVY